jgi:hypothetical protein
MYELERHQCTGANYMGDGGVLNSLQATGSLVLLSG